MRKSFPRDWSRVCRECWISVVVIGLNVMNHGAASPDRWSMPAFHEASDAEVRSLRHIERDADVFLHDGGITFLVLDWGKLFR